MSPPWQQGAARLRSYPAPSVLEEVSFGSLLRRAISGLRAKKITQADLAASLGASPVIVVRWHRYGVIPLENTFQVITPVLADLTGITEDQWWHSRAVAITERGPRETVLVKRARPAHNRKRREIRIGDQFGRWTVTSEEYWPPGQSHRFVDVRCSCLAGTVSAVRVSNLFTENSRSCGCLAKERMIQKGKYGNAKGPRTGFRKIPDLDNDRIRHLYVKKRWSRKRIARHLGCSPPTIDQRLTDMNIPLRARPPSQYDSLKGKDDLIRQLFAEELSQREVARRLGVQDRPVARKRKELNIPHTRPRARNRTSRCPQGHEYTPANTYISDGKYKHCRICDRDRARRRYREAHGLPT